MENFMKNLSQKLITMIYMYQAALLWIRISEKLRVRSTIGIIQCNGKVPNIVKDFEDLSDFPQVVAALNGCHIRNQSLCL